MSATRNAEPSAEETLTDAMTATSAGLPNELAEPHLFVALDCDQPRAGVVRYSLAQIDRVVLGRGAARSSTRSVEDGVRTLVLRLPDRRISARHAQLVRRGASFDVEDLGSRNGTRIDGVEAASPAPLSDGQLIEAGHTLFRYRATFCVPAGSPAEKDSADLDGTNALASIDPRIARASASLSRLAESTCPVLLLGETGTGKEVLARALHRLSRRKGAFVAVNCGALPPTLVEAQLFGHHRGAFSGAVSDAPGLVRSADHGTLLLDEVGDLPEPAQAALLRVLQEREVVPVGAAHAVPVDFRLIAATHRPLESLAARGEFRSDLLARLAGFTYRVPPLRARPEDIGLLVAAFVGTRAIRFTPSAGRALLRYTWPLNVRELRQAIEVATTLAGGAPVELHHLPKAVADAAPCDVAGAAAGPDDPVRKRLLASLARHRGNVTEVARELGKARMQVHRWLKRFGIDAKSFRPE